MGNMTLFIVGIAILSAGTYLMRLGGARLGSRLALSEGAVIRRRHGTAVFRRSGHHLL